MGCRERGMRTPSLPGRKACPSEGPSAGQSHLGVCGARARASRDTLFSWAPDHPADAVWRDSRTARMVSQFAGWYCHSEAGALGYLSGNPLPRAGFWREQPRPNAWKAGAWRGATLTRVTNRDQKKVGEPRATKRRTEQAAGPKLTQAKVSSGQVHLR